MLIISLIIDIKLLYLQIPLNTYNKDENVCKI